MFFAAIQLAVTDEYRRMKPEKRQELWFNGMGAGGQHINPPYVEIVFDNSDRRLPVGILSHYETVGMQHFVVAVI